MFKRDVLDAVEVSNEEIRAEVNRMFVKFAFRFIPLLDPSQAPMLLERWQSEGYEAALELVKTEQPEIATLSSQWQSPLVEAYDIDEALLEVLQDLPIGQPSSPILVDGQWVLFEVTDIRRTPIGDWEYAQKGETA
ncbi:hypothetical protein RZS08_45165, partial [Arthrospira platensis SPKY1]|nr:hypothetical protein [Arthrospira platensis SPKY1]